MKNHIKINEKNLKLTTLGFTLIELIAVIVILAIIALIATPIILNMINDAKKSAAKDSTYGYIKAIENKIALSALEDKYYEDRDNYAYDEIEVNLKGSKPTGGVYSLNKGVVTKGTFCIDGYTINYEKSIAEVVEKGCNGEELKLNGSIKLSSNSGNYTYPSSGTFEIIENISNGTLTCETSNSAVATCSISGTTVTVTPGTLEGNATLTIKSAATGNYKEAQAAYVVITINGTLLDYTVMGYSGIYDSNAHGITVTSSESTITYSTDGKTYSSTKPTYINAGTYTTYYKIKKEGYKEVTGSEDVVIAKAEGAATLSSTSGTVETDKTTTFTVSDATGTISCSTSSSNIATCSVSGTTITVTGASTGTATITINVAESTNYNSTSKMYSIIVKQPVLSDYVQLGDYISMTPTSTSFTTDTSKTGFTSTQTINPSELNVWRVINIKSDGTIEIVSENLSSTPVYFQGKTGYKNFVGYLNVLANQYQNTKYTVAARHMGYNGQTEYLTDTTGTVDSTSTTAPWTSSTSDNSNESKGGGDTLYTTDTDLVKNAIGTFVANNPSGTASPYWLASRRYVYGMSTYWDYGGRMVNSSGSIVYHKALYYFNGGFGTASNGILLRPILTLKSGIYATGSGTSTDPYVLQ